MMKNKLLAIILFVCITGLTAQNVGLGTNTPHASAKLDIQASNMGILIPQVDLNTVSFPAPGPATGLLVWNNNAGFGNGVGFYYNFGTTGAPSWLKVADTGSVNDADADPNNELQTIGKSGSTVTLSNGGGSFTDEVNDADADPTNEIQNVVAGAGLTDGGNGSTVNLNIGAGSGINVDANDIDVNVDGTEIIINGSNQLEIGNLPSGDADYIHNQNSVDQSANFRISGTGRQAKVIAAANGDWFLRGGDDSEFRDVNIVNTLGIWGIQNADRAGLQLGSDGSYIFGEGGNIGVSTVTPDYHLDVEGSGGVRMRVVSTDVNFAGYLSQNNDRQIFTGVSGNGYDIYDNTAGASRLFVNSIGNVGINTSAPSERLDVFGNIRSTGNYYLNNTSPTIYLQDSDNETGMIHMNSNLLYFLSGTGNNTTSWATNGSRWPLTINMANDVSTFGGAAHFMEGRVGIGTEAPAYDLDVKGNIYADGGWLRVSGNQGLYFESHGTGIHSVTADGGQYGSVSTYGNEGGWEGFSVAGRFVLMASGNSYGLYNDVDNRWAFLIDRGLNNDGYRFFNSFTGALNMRIQHTNGSNYASYDGDNNWDFYSDKRLKENIEKEGNILDRVLKLDVVNYDFINQERKDKEIGFIAQEVEKYFPSIVSESADERYGFKVKALGYSSFGVLAIGALKELKLEKDQELDDLKKTIDELNTKIDLQQKQIDKLIERMSQLHLNKKI